MTDPTTHTPTAPQGDDPQTPPARHPLGSASVWPGDCLDLLACLPDNSIDAIVTDPPYGIGFMGHAWDTFTPGAEQARVVENRSRDDANPNVRGRRRSPAASPSAVEYDRSLAGQRAFQAWTERWGREALRVLKPGGHAVVFGAPRAMHRTVSGLEEAGFEIRDMLLWQFGCLSEDTEILINGRWEHYRAAIVGSLALCYDAAHDAFAWQPIRAVIDYPYCDTAYHLHSDRTDQIVSRNHRCLVERGGSYVFQYAETLECEATVPILENLSDVLAAVPMPDQGASHTAQAIRGQGLTAPDLVRVTPIAYEGRVWCVNVPTGAFVARRNGRVFVTGNSGFPKSLDVSKAIDKAAGVSAAGDAARWAGFGTALKPAYEPIVLCRKLLDGTVAQTVLTHGTGALNIDGCRVGGDASPDGRWPPHLLHDGSPEVLATFPSRAGAASPVTGDEPSPASRGAITGTRARVAGTVYADEGSAARFFPSLGFTAAEGPDVAAILQQRALYQPKTARSERHYGCEMLPVVSAGEMTGGRQEGSAGLNSPRAGAGRTGRLYSYAKVLYPSASWVNAVLGRRLPAGTARSLMTATVGSTIHDNDGRAWSMCWCGSPSTDVSHPAIRSIIGTESSWTTDRTISNSSGQPHTNGCMAAAFGVKALGGNPVGFAESSSPSVERTGTSATKAGRSMDGAAPAISIESWLTSAPEESGIRLGNAASHPTVKPIRLMRWLCRLITPPGGIILDPFLGSGTTAIAAVLEGFECIGMEREAAWVTLAETRIAAWSARPDGHAVTEP